MFLGKVAKNCNADWNKILRINNSKQNMCENWFLLLSSNDKFDFRHQQDLNFLNK